MALNDLFFITLLLVLPFRVYGWVPEARLSLREFGAFVDDDEMLELRSPAGQGQTFLPTFNPLHRAHRMFAPQHSTDKKTTEEHSLKPRNHLPGYSDPAMMQDLQGSKGLHENSVMKLFYNKKHHLPDSVDVFGRDGGDLRTKLEEMEDDLEDFQPPTEEKLDAHTKKIYFEPRHKLPDKHYGSEL